MSSLVEFQQWLGDLESRIYVQADELQMAAENQVLRIKQRTAQGVNVDGQVFAPYSPNTKKNGPVDLRKTGVMMDSIVVEANDMEARIGFSDSDAAARALYNNNGTRAQIQTHKRDGLRHISPDHTPQRYFFGVSIQDKEEIISDIKQKMLQRINS